MRVQRSAGDRPGDTVKLTAARPSRCRTDTVLKRRGNILPVGWGVSCYSLPNAPMRPAPAAGRVGFSAPGDRGRAAVLWAGVA